VESGLLSRLIRWWQVVAVLLRCILIVPADVYSNVNVRATTRRQTLSFRLEELCDANVPFGMPVTFTFPFHLAINSNGKERKELRDVITKKS